MTRTTRTTHLSALWRSVVPWQPATAWMLTAAVIVLVAAGVSHGLQAGERGALAVFLAWAITRELAPRRALPSLLAPFAAVAFAIPADTDVLSCAGVLFAARIAARSVGDPPTLLDLLLLVPLAGFLATRPPGLPVALVLAAVVFADGPRLMSRAAGVIMLLVAIVVGATEGTLTARPGWDQPADAAQLLLAFTAAFAIWLLVAPLPARLLVRDDRDHGPLRGPRIRAARVATVACVLAAIAWTGTDGAFALSAASAALLAAGLGGARARSAPAPSGTLRRDSSSGAPQ